MEQESLEETTTEISTQTTSADRPMSELEEAVALEEAQMATEAPAEEIVEEKDKDPLKKIIVSRPVAIYSREDLEDVLRNHADWLESVINPRKKISGGRANLKNADLSGYDLRGVNLSGATMIGTNLAGADLSGAVLTGADFTEANLQGAKFIKAKLRRAVLVRANLTEADFSEADMRQVNAEGAVVPSPSEEAPPPAEEQEGAPQT